MDSGRDVSPLLNWKIPYSEKTIRWSILNKESIGVLSLDAGRPIFDEKWKTVIIEGPEGLWCAWLMQDGSPCAWAPTLLSTNERFGELCMQQMRRATPRYM